MSNIESSAVKEKLKMSGNFPYVHLCQNSEMPWLEILMPAYNHAAFIEKAIKSILMQQTEYSYKIKIGEDCSTDTTRKIIMEYYEKYPDKIELYLWKKNVGPNKNFIELVKSCEGKYIAVLEGDDYWTDPLKLEKQISFLEKHEKYIGTAHNVRCVNVDGELLHRDFGLYPICEEHIYGKEQAIKLVMAAQTASLLYHNIWKCWEKEDVENFLGEDGNGDLKINIILGLLGDIYYFKDIMADHIRNFQGDSWTAKSYNRNMLWFLYLSYCVIQKYVKKYTNTSLGMKKIFDELFEESIIRLLSNHSKDNLNVYLRFLKKKIIRGLYI